MSDELVRSIERTVPVLGRTVGLLTKKNDGVVDRGVPRYFMDNFTRQRKGGQQEMRKFFSEENTKNAIVYAKDAYSNNIQSSDKLIKNTITSTPSFKDTPFSFLSKGVDDSISANIYYDPSTKNLSISFKGTTSISEGLLDASYTNSFAINDNYQGQSSQYFSGNIHPGFARAYESIRDKLAKELIKYPDANITFTGHSLGGALAELAGNDKLLIQPFFSDLSQALTPRKTSVISFGAPQVGDKNFADNYNSNTKLDIIVFKQDPVTIANSSYMHPTSKVWDLSTKSDSGVPSFDYHSLDSYVKGIERVESDDPTLEYFSTGSNLYESADVALQIQKGIQTGYDAYQVYKLAQDLNAVKNAFKGVNINLNAVSKMFKDASLEGVFNSVSKAFDESYRFANPTIGTLSESLQGFASGGLGGYFYSERKFKASILKSLRNSYDDAFKSVVGSAGKTIGNEITQLAATSLNVSDDILIGIEKSSSVLKTLQGQLDDIGKQILNKASSVVSKMVPASTIEKMSSSSISKAISKFSGLGGQIGKGLGNAVGGAIAVGFTIDDTVGDLKRIDLEKRYVHWNGERVYATYNEDAYNYIVALQSLYKTVSPKLSSNISADDFVNTFFGRLGENKEGQLTLDGVTLDQADFSQFKEYNYSENLGSTLNKTESILKNIGKFFLSTALTLSGYGIPVAIAIDVADEVHEQNDINFKKDAFNRALQKLENSNVESYINEQANQLYPSLNRENESLLKKAIFGDASEEEKQLLEKSNINYKSLGDLYKMFKDNLKNDPLYFEKYLQNIKNAAEAKAQQDYTNLESEIEKEKAKIEAYNKQIIDNENQVNTSNEANDVMRQDDYIDIMHNGQEVQGGYTNANSNTNENKDDVAITGQPLDFIQNSFGEWQIKFENGELKTYLGGYIEYDGIYGNWISTTPNGKPPLHNLDIFYMGFHIEKTQDITLANSRLYERVNKALIQNVITTKNIIEYDLAKQTVAYIDKYGNTYGLINEYEASPDNFKKTLLSNLKLTVAEPPSYAQLPIGTDLNNTSLKRTAEIAELVGDEIAATKFRKVEYEYELYSGLAKEYMVKLQEKERNNSARSDFTSFIENSNLKEEFASYIQTILYKPISEILNVS